MISEEIVAKLRERYPSLHPLMFHRSVERAKSPADLFDILESVPDKYPWIWDEDQHQWMHTDDLFQIKSFVEG